jgi:hypothetical protein
VTKDSAGLNGCPAYPINGADHREICRFENKFSNGYRLIVDKLRRIKDRLLGLANAEPVFENV